MNRKKHIKMLVASMLCVVMACSVLVGMPELLVSAEDTATETTTTTGQSYGGWQDTEPVNGSFEVGYEGMEVHGWSKTAINNSHAKDTSDANNYCSHFTLTTAEEDGNKVAALTKTSNGQVAATSQSIAVTGGQEYSASFDYKTYSVTEGNYYGVRLYIEELDAEGNITNEAFTTRTHGVNYYSDTANNSSWTTGTVQFTTQESTESVVIYLWMGAAGTVSATVYFDNVTLEVVDDTLGYTAIDATNKGVLRSESATTTYTTYFGIQKVNAGLGYENATQLYVTNSETGATGGVAFYKSYTVEAGATYRLQLDYKVEGIDTTVTEIHGADVLLRYQTDSAADDSVDYDATNQMSYFCLYNSKDYANIDWTTCDVTFTVPESVTEVEIGFLISVGVKNSQPDLKETFANIGLALEDDTDYWTEYEKRSETDLLFKMLEGGNATGDESGTVDVCDLVRMKTYIADSENTTISNDADMNRNQLINTHDLKLLIWKILGVTTTSEAQSVQ